MGCRSLFALIYSPKPNFLAKSYINVTYMNVTFIIFATDN